MTQLPGRHGQPLTPLEMSDADALEFAQQIATGYHGRAPWRRLCVCDHPANVHHPTGGCTRCTRCRHYQRAGHESLVIWLHPDAVNYLPPDVTVRSVGNSLEPIGSDEHGNAILGYQYLLVRDLDVGRVAVVRSGVRRETTVYTSPPDDMEVPE